MLARRIARHGLTILATVLLGGFFSATLVRLAPGFDVDEAQLDPHLNSQSIEALRQARQDQHNVFLFYVRAVERAVHGDLGKSISLQQPIVKLLHDRAPVSIRLVALGLVMSWAA